MAFQCYLFRIHNSISDVRWCWVGGKHFWTFLIAKISWLFPLPKWQNPTNLMLEEILRFQLTMDEILLYYTKQMLDCLKACIKWNKNLYLKLNITMHIFMHFFNFKHFILNYLSINFNFCYMSLFSKGVNFHWKHFRIFFRLYNACTQYT